MIISRFPTSSAQDFLSGFHFTGESEVAFSDEGIQELRLYTSGTLTIDKPHLIDIFLVGGGGGGGHAWGGARYTPLYYEAHAGGGGAGGYTTTVNRYEAEYGEYTVQVGSGGNAGASGGKTSITKKQTAQSEAVVIGEANPGTAGTARYGYSGGSGGSGGGQGEYGKTLDGDPSGNINIEVNKTIGAVDGADAVNDYPSAGKGQGTTTRAFGLATGALYASGGDGGDADWDGATEAYSGERGTGDGGEGSSFYLVSPTGGDEYHTVKEQGAGKGGSGIVIIRIA